MTSSPLRHSPWTTALPGLFSRDLLLEVPLDRSGGGDTMPGGSPTLTIYAREIVARAAGGATEPPELPYLVFLQGGPGCESPRPGGDGGLGWLAALTEHYRVILLDQRGTGASTPVDRPDLAGSAQRAAAVLTHMRADEIVEDCEDLRRALGVERWSLLGQSFGGFCTVRYVHAHPSSLEQVFLTGGLPSVDRGIDEVYTLTYAAMQAKSEEHYARFPHDRARMAALVERAASGELLTAAGERVSVARLRSLGSLLGASGGGDQLHFLLERDPGSWAFRHDLATLFPFGGRNPLYSVIHESCWANGGSTRWCADRVRPASFTEDPTLLTGEHVSRAFFEEDATLRPWLEVADLLAEVDWPALYSPAGLRSSGVTGAAAVYARDVYVPLETSLATAAHMPGLRTWVTSEWEHNGSRASGGEVFRRLHALAGGLVLR